MAAVEKLSVSIQKNELDWARKYAKASGQSLSAVLTEALRDKRRMEAMDRLIKKYGTDRFTAKQLAKARAELHGSSK
jgi:hypothetical protein